MPYITLEYTPNITDIDFLHLFDALKTQLVATGEVQALGVKCRAVTCTDYYIVDGNADYKMVNLLFRLREGRSLAVRQQISTIGMTILEKYFENDIKNKTIILSTEVKELVAGLDLLKNAIR